MAMQMTRSSLPGITALLLATGATVVNAATKLPSGEMSAREVLEAYDKKLLPEHRKMVEDLLQWMQNGLLWANALLEKRGQPPLYCQPHRLTITGPMVIDMVRKGIRDNPGWSEQSFDMIVVLSIQRTFPCPSQPDPGFERR